MNNNTIINLNIASYFLNILASPDRSTWNTTGGPITKTTSHIGLTKHHRSIVEITWHMVHWKKYHKALWSTLPFKNSDEINILADALENHIGLRYTTHLINCHFHHDGLNVVCNCTVNL